MFIYLKSKNYEEVKFSLLLLKDFFSDEKKIILNERYNIIDNIFECMNQYINDKFILYQGLSVLINYIYHTDNIENFLVSNSFLQLYEFILNLNDIELFFLILLLLFNISISDNNEINYIILTSNLLNQILNLFNQKELTYLLDEENNIYYDIVYQGFNLFLNLMKVNNENVQSSDINQIKKEIIKIVIKFINTNIENLYFLILNNITIYYNYVKDSSNLISIFLIETIINQKKFKSNSNLLITNRVIGNYLSNNDITDLSLIDLIINFEISILIKLNTIEAKKDVFWSIGNLICNSNLISDLLIEKNNFIELLIKNLKEDNDKSELKEILITLGNLICNIKFDNFIILSKTGIFNELICSLIKFEKEEDLLPFIFQNISFFIEKGNLVKNFTNNNNSILNDFNAKGGKDFLIKYQFCKSELLRNVVEKMLNNFYHNIK